MIDLKEVVPSKGKNFIFLGEAGSGKSEISINFAINMAKNNNKKVHFFDMDMTKPLFRSRDLSEYLKEVGVEFHCQEQFMDAPTLVGGVNHLLKSKDEIVVMDVGGDYIGARSLGGFAPLINKEDTVVYYVLNNMRPWSYDIEHIDGTLGKILGVSHIDLSQVRFIDNSNNGITTTADEYLEGSNNMVEIVTQYKPIDFSCVNENLYDEVKDKARLPLFLIHLYLTYEWLEEQVL
ncbi:nucleotide-binding protein [Intestinibacter sp.]|uniref:nucleotide-binding protein n=1 Tax=Intestinibacter sp. TaxID=1965304 RepID=UPI003F17F23C